MQNYRFEINVEGISCIKCVGKIEQSLKEQDPVPTTIKVDFITNKVVLTMPDRELIEIYSKAIEKLGFKVGKMSEINLSDEETKRQLKIKIIKGNSIIFKSELEKFFENQIETRNISNDSLNIKYDPLVVRGSSIISQLKQSESFLNETLDFEIENPFDEDDDIKFSNYSGYQVSICLLCMLLLVILSLIPDDYTAYPQSWGIASIPMLTTLIMTAIIMKVVGISIFRTCIKQFAVQNYNMITLISLGSGFAFFLGMIYFIVGAFKGQMALDEMVFFICNACQHLQTSSAIFTSVVTGKYIQGKIKERVNSKIIEIKENMKANIETIQRFIPKNRKLDFLGTEDLHPGLIERDDLIYAKVGMLPFDGFVEKGTIKLMENAQFGSETIDIRTKGHRVVSGSRIISTEDEPLIRVTEPIERTLTGKLFSVIRDSASGNSLDEKTSSFIGSFTKYFISFILITSAVIFGFWIFDYWFSFTGMVINACYPFEKAVAVLVASCPCALGTALPMIYVVAIRKALKNGVLVKDSSAIDEITDIDTVVFDKTGTITGKYNMRKASMIGDSLSEQDIWEIISLIERDHLQHPIGLTLYQQALKNLAQREKSKTLIQKEKMEEAHNYFGSEGIVDKSISINGSIKKIAIGNEKLMKRIGATQIGEIQEVDVKKDFSQISANVDESTEENHDKKTPRTKLAQSEGLNLKGGFTSTINRILKGYFTLEEKNDSPIRTQKNDNTEGNVITIFLAIDAQIVFNIELDLEENLKDNVHKLIASLHRIKVDIHLLTGDSRENALETAKNLRIKSENVKAEVTPFEKEDYIRSLRAANHKVLMVGDGINDIKAFQEATLSCTINFKSPQNLSFSNFVIIDNDVENIRGLFKLGRATRYFKIAILGSSILYNIPAILASSGLLMILFDIDLPAFMAAWTMFVSSLFLTLLANLVDFVKFKDTSYKKIRKY